MSTSGAPAAPKSSCRDSSAALPPILTAFRGSPPANGLPSVPRGEAPLGRLPGGVAWMFVVSAQGNSFVSSPGFGRTAEVELTGVQIRPHDVSAQRLLSSGRKRNSYRERLHSHDLRQDARVCQEANQRWVLLQRMRLREHDLLRRLCRPAASRRHGRRSHLRHGLDELGVVGRVQSVLHNAESSQSQAIPLAHEDGSKERKSTDRGTAEGKMRR